MAVNYSNAIKDLRMTAALGSTGAGGIDTNASAATIEIATAAYASVLVIITLAKPSFTEAAQTLTMAGAPKSGVAAVTGTAAVARIKDGGGTVAVNNLTVGLSGSDINLNSTSIISGQTVTLTAGTITHAT
jgi:hypothetical protein